MAGGEAYNPPHLGRGQHCFVHLEPLGVSAQYLVVTLEHELVHVQCRPGEIGSLLETKGSSCKRAGPISILPHQIPVKLGGSMPCSGL